MLFRGFFDEHVCLREEVCYAGCEGVKVVVAANFFVVVDVILDTFSSVYDHLLLGPPSALHRKSS